MTDERIRELREWFGLEAGAQWRVDLWNYINEYAVTVGGRPDRHVYGNVSRQMAVCRVEGVLSPLVVAMNEALDEIEAIILAIAAQLPAPEEVAE